MDYPLTLIDHPLAAHKLTLLRDKGCDSTKARQLVYELGVMLTIEATRDLPLAGWAGTNYEDQPYTGPVMAKWNVVAVAIMRSGLVLAEAFSSILPSTRIGHLGIHQDYNKPHPQTYLVSVPSAPADTDIFVLDSLIGTGETMKMAVSELRDLKIEPRQLRLAVLSVHEQGLATFYAEPDNWQIPVFAFERVSGMGDNQKPAFGFGNTADRLFGTGGK